MAVVVKLEEYKERVNLSWVEPPPQPDPPNIVIPLQPPASPIDRPEKPRVRGQQRRLTIAIEHRAGMAKGSQAELVRRL